MCDKAPQYISSAHQRAALSVGLDAVLSNAADVLCTERYITSP